MRLGLALLFIALCAVGCARRFDRCEHCADFLLLGLSSSTVCAGDRYLTIHGGGATTSSIYNPATNTYTAGPSFASGPNTGSVGFQIPNFGPRACQNVVARGNNTTTGYYYAPRTQQVTSFTFSGGTFQVGAHVIRYGSGVSTRFLLIHGNSLVTTIYNPSTDTFTSGPSMLVSSGAGVLSFQVPSGPLSGKFLIANAGSGANWRTFDPDSETIVAHGTSPLGPNTDSSAVLIASGGTAGQIFIAVGGSATDNMIYNPATDGFGAVGTVSTPQGAGANTFTVDGGANSGRVFIVRGLGGTGVDMYTPGGLITNPGVATVGAVSAGGHNYLIPSGTEAGNRLIVRGAGTGIDVFRHSSNTFNAVGGLSLTAAAGASAHSMPLAD